MPSILELHVVSSPFVHILSFTATGTPARGPASFPLSISFCTSSARFNAPSLSTVTKLFISASFAFIASSAALAASGADTSLFWIFFPSPTAVKFIKDISSSIQCIYYWQQKTACSPIIQLLS